MANWKRVSNFLPTIWLSAKGDDATACRQAAGRWCECILQSYTPKEREGRDGKKRVDHFYTAIVQSIGPDTNPPHATLAVEQNGKLGYEDVPFTPNEVYTIKAGGGLHYQLSQLWSNPEAHYGRPLRITYEGLGSFERDGEKQKVHKFSVERDMDFVPQIAMGSHTPPQISHDRPVAEEPLKPIEW